MTMSTLSCAKCGKVLSVYGNNPKVKNKDGTSKTYCRECFVTLPCKCHDCGKMGVRGTFTAVKLRFGASNDRVCKDCLEKLYQRCDHCGKYRPADTEWYRCGDDAICEHCYDEDYFRCSECGEVFGMEDTSNEDGVCDDCRDRMKDDEEMKIFKVDRQIGDVSFGNDPETDKQLSDPKSEF